MKGKLEKIQNSTYQLAIKPIPESVEAFSSTLLLALTRDLAYIPLHESCILDNAGVDENKLSDSKLAHILAGSLRNKLNFDDVTETEKSIFVWIIPLQTCVKRCRFIVYP